MSKIKVAFILEDFARWEGGKTYIDNLLKAIFLDRELKIEPCVFIGTSSHYQSFKKKHPQCTFITSNIFDKGTYLWILRYVIIFFTLKDILLEKLLVRENVKLVSHNMNIFLKANKKFKLFAWLSDFQHKCMKNFFPRIIREKRNIWFYYLCKNSERIILSSEVAKEHLGRYYPKFYNKADVLNFVADISAAKVMSSEGICKKYALPGRFFYVPNQFWRHKNHDVVIEALADLKHDNRDICIVCTGDTHDYRYPRYFAKVLNKVEKLGVQNNLKILGKVDRDDVVNLMKYCVAVINPSFFEGWSTSVEEAKSMGKQLILSDIPVHREQDPERVFYFNPNSSKELAKAINSSLRDFSFEEDRRYTAEALKKIENRFKDYERAYLKIIGQ